MIASAVELGIIGARPEALNTATDSGAPTHVNAQSGGLRCSRSALTIRRKRRPDRMVSADLREPGDDAPVSAPEPCANALARRFHGEVVPLDE